MHVSGEEIAVKLLHNNLHGTDDEQFKREFENLMRLDHHNIVQLVGYCYETQHKPIICTEETIFAEEITKALCFEYMQKGSLQKHLSGMTFYILSTLQQAYEEKHRRHVFSLNL